jgi:two-component system sensor histidine kinase FlrB
MLPCSHSAPINVCHTDLRPSPVLLADAFSEFISASSLLEASYRDLQEEVARLRVELAERNSALMLSIAENERMRVALQQIIDSMPCGVLVLDTTETIVTMNPEGRRLLDLGVAQVRNLKELTAVSQVNLELLGAGSNDDPDSEVCINSSAGKRWLAIGNHKLSCLQESQASASQGISLHSIWILRDITAGKHAEQEREAARSAMALAEISTVLAHEIKNPLASMELFAGLIAEDPSQSSQWVSHLRAGIRLLSGTVNNVLSIHGGSCPHLGPVDLTSCVQSGVEFAQPIADQASVKLSVVGADKQLKILGNENGLRQVLLNLICNAIRHTPAGGSIRVSVKSRRQGSGVSAMVEVRDTGCGIPPNAVNQVFDAGFSTSGDTPGLGLAVCKRLMIQHGGAIHVSSRVNYGSTFQLEFPTI